MHGSFRRDVQEPALTEPRAVKPTFCHGFASVDVIGKDIHLVGYIDQLDCFGQLERSVNLRVIMPMAGITTALPVVAKVVMGQAASALTNLAPYLSGWATLVHLGTVNLM